ncbi:MAG: beta-phosphoglucomutase [Bacteroidetes bacterium]|nr:MAG: beta-phosphoglucomutase [Bacteroidota bacterium]
MNRKGFIFDLDGVIVDTAKYHYLAWKKLSESIGIFFDEFQNEQLKGVNRINSLEKILGWGNKELSQDKFMELLARKNNDYLDYISNMTRSEILPDVVRIISFLKDTDQSIALGSSSRNARIILKKLKLIKDFDAVVDGNNVSESKPNPEVFLLAAEELNVTPQDCVVFEDSIAGVKAANEAGMMSIGIGDEKVLKEADYVFTDFTKISNQFMTELITK